MMKKQEEIAKWESSEVRFAINSYEDIFSDFDPRPIPIKGFSEDFLSEAKRAVITKEEQIDFIFMVPKTERNIREEIKIENRLKQYFKKHLAILEKEKKRVIKKGLAFTIVGILLMLVATYLFFTFKNASFAASFFTIMLEPASWFLFWEGLDLIIFEAEKIGPNLDFHRKMVKAKISFIST